MNDDMTLLDLLDPTRPDDPRFDVNGDQARRVRAAAVAGDEAAPLPRTTWNRPRRVAMALVAATAAAAAGIVLLDSGSPNDARAALERAAERTAAVDSGRVIWTQRADPPGPEDSVIRVEIRFSGGDLVMRVRERTVLEGGRERREAYTYIEVGSFGYSHDDKKPDAVFDKTAPTDETDFPHQIVRHVGSKALVALVRGADDFSARPAPGGATVYRATVTAGQVFDASPTAAGRVPTPAWERPVALEVTVGETGLIERVVSTGVVTQTVEYLDLNTPQAIERPAKAVELPERLPPELTDR